MAVERGRRLDRALASSNLRGPDRAWVHHLTYGVSRLRGRLDHLLDQTVSRGLRSVRRPVLVALRMGLFQLAEMDAVPDHAAVSQTVALARSLGGEGAAGLANGVLRALLRAGHGRERFPSADDGPIDHLTSWGSHPRWLVERWLGRWSVAEVACLVDLDNQVPHLYVRPFDHDVEAALARFRDLDVDASAVGQGTGCVRVPEGVTPERALQVVRGFVQDPAAALVTHYAAPPRSGIVADLCAAPGGKALGLRGPQRTVLACDASEPRMRLLANHVRRAGLDGVSLAVARAEHAPLRAADVVLVDVPCTGTGTLRRHPDARWRLRPKDVPKLAHVQRRILTAAAERVTMDGLLVYSTCSLEPEENQDQVDWFLAEHAGFSLEPAEDVDSEFVDERGCLVVLPQRTGFDGAFAARFRRHG